MRFLILLCILFVPLFSSAQEKSARPTSLRVYLLNPELRFERNAEQEIAPKTPLNFALSVSRMRYSFLLEYSRLSENSGNQSSSIQRTHEEALLWFRYHYLNLKNRDGSVTTHLYGGVGAGAYQETVDTTLLGDTRQDMGKQKFLSSLSLGAEISYALNQAWAAVMNAEGRALVASELDPNPQGSLLLRLGLAYAF